MAEPLFRYRARICRRVPLEPIDDPALLEQITVHAADASDARRRIAWVTGAPIVFDAERLDDDPVAIRNVDVPALSLSQIAGGGALGCVVFA